MQADFSHDGRTVDYTPSSAVTGGDVVVQNDLVGVAEGDIAANVQDSLAIEGAYDLNKASGAGVTFAVGNKVYWDDANNLAVRTPSGNKYVGVCVKAAANGDSKVKTKLVVTGFATEGLIFSSEAASAVVTNTVAETDFDKSVTIPANTLQAGDVIRVVAQGIAPSTNATDTLTIRLKIGGTTVIATAAVDVANNDIFLITADIVIRTVGAGGTMVAAGTQALGVEGTVTAKPAKLASTALDTLVAATVKASAQWSVANAGNQVRLDVLNAEILRK